MPVSRFPLFSFGRATLRDEPRATSSRPRRLSAPKRVGFTLVLVLLAWLLLEIGAFFLFWLATGMPFSWSEAQRLRGFHVNQSDSRASAGFAQVHPYVGYVEEPRASSGIRRLADDASMPVSEFGYIDHKLPIQRTARTGW